VLYGACLIKGVGAGNLGNLADANITSYETTLRNVQTRCPDPKFIVVSHSDWKNNKSLKHSIRLAKQLKKKN
jgi:metallo-beta-lactamase class B